MKLDHSPITGNRTLKYDSDLGLIIDETITKFPSPYTINRYAPITGKNILLTFDDGPSTYTPAILDILKKENVPAVFFII